MSKPKFKMGRKVTDRATGFEGRIMGIADYATGCRQYLIQPECDKDRAKLPHAQWLDEGRLAYKQKESGGPQPCPPPIR